MCVEELVRTAVRILGKGSYCIEKDATALHEATLLKLDISKAFNLLNWKPVFTMEEAVERTIRWYERLTAGRENIPAFTMKEIETYLNRVRS